MQKLGGDAPVRKLESKHSKKSSDLDNSSDEEKDGQMEESPEHSGDEMASKSNKSISKISEKPSQEEDADGTGSPPNMTSPVGSPTGSLKDQEVELDQNAYQY